MGHSSTTIAIRPESPEDHDAIRQLVTAAFASDKEPQLVERIRASPEYVPELALVAEVDGEVVGHVMVSHATLRSVDGDQKISVLAPLAVHPDRQNAGIGSALVRAVLAVAEQHGEPLVILEGNPTYYGRLGFEHAERYGIEVDLPEWAPPEAAQVRPLRSFDPNEPALRGTLIYPNAFDDLE